MKFLGRHPATLRLGGGTQKKKKKKNRSQPVVQLPPLVLCSSYLRCSQRGSQPVPGATLGTSAHSLRWACPNHAAVQLWRVPACPPTPLAPPRLPHNSRGRPPGNFLRGREFWQLADKNFTSHRTINVHHHPTNNQTHFIPRFSFALAYRQEHLI